MNFIFVALIHLVDASTWTIRVDRSNNAFPVEYIAENGIDTFPGLAQIGVGESRDVYFYHHNSRVLWGESFSSARGLRIPNTTVEIEFEEILHVPRDHVSVLTIGASPTSSFAQRVSGFLVAPVSATESIIVLNPSNPEDYAYENSLYYASRTHNRDIWEVSGAIAMSGTSSESSISFGAHERDRPQIPPVVMDEFSSTLTRLNVRSSLSLAGMYLHDLTEETTAMMPSVEYRIIAENGQQVRVSCLDFHEYLGDTRTRAHAFLAHPTDRSAMFVLLATHGTLLRPRSPRLFPRNIEREIVLHFDIQNNRIGFGEPLFEH